MKTCAFCGGIIQTKQGFMKSSTETATRFMHCLMADCRENADVVLSDRCIMRLSLLRQTPPTQPETHAVHTIDPEDPEEQLSAPIWFWRSILGYFRRR